MEYKVKVETLERGSKVMYTDESCLEKISSRKYRAASFCESVIQKNRKEFQKSLIKRIK